MIGDKWDTEDTLALLAAVLYGVGVGAFIFMLLLLAAR